jgi:hypothetical protein
MRKGAVGNFTVLVFGHKFFINGNWILLSLQETHAL